MSAYAVLSIYLLALVAATATARGARNPVRMTERGSAVLVWLHQNPRPGNASSRLRVKRAARKRVWRGLRLAGVYYPLLCLHSHEGAWNSNTGNGYWGGLQMDGGFMASYGPEYLRTWGTADRWPIALQMNAAYRAQRVRGWSPWGTRSLCGL